MKRLKDQVDGVVHQVERFVIFEICLIGTIRPNVKYLGQSVGTSVFARAVEKLARLSAAFHFSQIKMEKMAQESAAECWALDFEVLSLWVVPT